MQQQSILGARVLVVEDEQLIALDIDQICTDSGATSVTIVSTIEDALAVDPATFDIAVLDRSLAGKSTVNVARRLQASGVPFIFSSGWSDDAELAEFPKAPLVQKPYSTKALLEAMASVLKK